MKYYKIKAVFTSDVKNIYTEETETADNEFMRDLKYCRMVKRWFDILCSNYLNVIPELSSCDIKKVEFLLNIIKLQVETLNTYHKGEQDRTFNITIEEINIE